MKHLTLMEEERIQILAENIRRKDTIWKIRAQTKGWTSNIRYKRGERMHGLDTSGSGCRSMTEYKPFGLHTGRQHFSLSVA